MEMSHSLGRRFSNCSRKNQIPSPGGLLKTDSRGLLLHSVCVSWSGMCSRMLHSPEVPGDAEAAGPGTTLDIYWSSICGICP